MVKAIRIHETGGPEVLALEDVAVGAPGPGQILVRHTAIGVNFIDTYHRTGLYPVALPSGLGLEAAGVVDAVGPDVTRPKVGDRVAYASGPLGAYSQAQLCPADRVVRIPDAIGDDTAAAMLLKGLTVQFLLRQTFPVRPGHTVLIHAAAGGVGLMACQWAKHLGATVIGTVGSAEKADLARANGCDHTILYRSEDVAARVKDITGGQGVPVVYDGVGKDTWDMSLDCLAPRGLMVSYGNASGAVPPFAPAVLAAKGSLFVTRPTLFHYASTPEALQAMAEDLMIVIMNGHVSVRVDRTLPLDRAADAHRALEARETAGAIVLKP